MEKIKEQFWRLIIIPFVIEILLIGVLLLFVAMKCIPLEYNGISIIDIIMIILIITQTLFAIILIFIAILPMMNESLYNNIIRKGHIFYHLKKYEAAAYCFGTAEDYMRDIPGTYYVWGNALTKLGEEAENKSEKRMAKKFFKDALEKYDIAKDKYEKSKKQNGLYWDVRCDRAYILFRLEKYPCAVNEFREIIKQRPDSSETHKALGIVLSEWGKREKMESKAKEHYGEAEESFRNAVELDKEYWEAYYGLANILHNLYNLTKNPCELSEAKDKFEKTIELKPDHAEAHYGLGNVLSQLGESKNIEAEAKEYYESAEKSYNEAIRLNPNLEQAYINLRNVLVKLGKGEDVTDLEKEYKRRFRKTLG